MIDLLLGLAFGVLLLRLAERLQQPRPIPVPIAQRFRRGRRP